MEKNYMTGSHLRAPVTIYPVRMGTDGPTCDVPVFTVFCNGKPQIEVYLKTVSPDDDVPKLMSFKERINDGVKNTYPAVEPGACIGIVFRPLTDDLDKARVQITYDGVEDVPMLINLGAKHCKTTVTNFASGSRQQITALAVGSADGDSVGLEQGDAKNGSIEIKFTHISYKKEPFNSDFACRGATRGATRGSSGFGEAGTVASGPSGPQLPTGRMTGWVDPKLSGVLSFRYLAFDPKFVPEPVRPKYQSVASALAAPPVWGEIL